MSPRTNFARPVQTTLAAAALAAAAFTLVPSAAHAQEAVGKVLYDDAMDNDYLNMKFDDAIGKLNKAVSKCGTKCSSGLLGKLHVALGVVYGAGKGDMRKAKVEFEKAFAADSNAQPLEIYFNDDLRKIFAAAKKSAPKEEEASDEAPAEEEEAPKRPAKPEPKKAPKPEPKKEIKKKPVEEEPTDEGAAEEEEAPKKRRKRKPSDEEETSSSESVEWAPPPEARVNTPLPIFMPVDDGLGAKSAKLRYKPLGETKWSSMAMKKMAGGFGATIPCNQITTTGKLKLYIYITDKDGEPVAQAGTAKAPLEISIRNEIDGEQPRLPGEKAPKPCSSVECPPDFPGCNDAKKGDESASTRGNKGWGASCEQTEECKEGYSCISGSCEQADGESTSRRKSSDEEGSTSSDSGEGGDAGADAGTRKPLPKNLLSLGVQLDALFLESAMDVCGGVDPATNALTTYDNYACFYADGSGEFLGKPLAGRFNEIQGGAALASTRIVLGYDRILWKGLTLGARVGYGFGGSPSIGDAENRAFNCSQIPEAQGGGALCRAPASQDFMPVNAEVQVKYFPLEDRFAPTSLFMPRPYLFAGFGVIGQVNGGVAVDVCDTAKIDGTLLGNTPAVDICGAGAQKRQVEAYQVTGMNFVPVGIGAIVPFHKNVGLGVELKAMFMFPTSGMVLSPSFGPVGFF